MFRKSNGEVPVKDFINSLDVKMQAKVMGTLSVLQEYGNELREPYSKHLEDGIFEIRTKIGNDITRVLYFFYYERKIPKEEIEKAKQYRHEYMERVEKHGKV